MFPQWLLETLGSAAIASALVSLLMFLLQSILIERLKGAVKAEYDEKLESHKAQLAATNSKELEVLKAQLKAHSDTELEHFKSNLQIEAQKQSARFVRLHERRLDAIAQVHEHLMRVQADLGFYIAAFEMAGGPSRAEKLDKLSATYEQFRECFVKGQIFLPRAVVKMVSHLESEYRRISNQYTIIVRGNPNHIDHQLWIKLNEQLEGSVDEAMKSLQEEMRLSLGDPPEPTTVV